MLGDMRRAPAIGLFAAVVAVVGVVVLFIAHGRSRFTECVASFESPQIAQRAIEATREEGFDAELRTRSERIVIFSSEETGDDGSQFRTVFRQVVEAEEGKLAHPGGGCLERSHLN
jgi:hypothetical protein